MLGARATIFVVATVVDTRVRGVGAEVGEVDSVEEITGNEDLELDLVEHGEPGGADHEA